MTADVSIAALNERLIEEIGRGAEVDPRVADAFRAIPRHLFLEDYWTMHRGFSTLPGQEREPRRYDRLAPDADALEEIYSDAPLVTKCALPLATSSASAPSLVAKMLTYLDVRPGHRVLEVGTGTGFNAALLGYLARPGRVVAVEAQEDVHVTAEMHLASVDAENVQLLYGDGILGAPGHGPFDRIVATVCVPDLPPRWLAQLAPDGRILAPIDHAGPMSPLMLLAGREGRVVAESWFMAGVDGFATSGPWPPVPWTGDPPARLCEAGSARATPLPPDAPAGDDEALRLRLFLACTDRRAWNTPCGYGLRQPDRGWAVITPDDTLTSGQDASSERARSDLLAALERWTALGRPRLTDYASRFVVPGTVTADEHRWIVERPFHDQVVELRRHAEH